MRVLHISDVHVTVPLRSLPWHTMLNKRLIGAANLALRRGQHFAAAREKLAALSRLAEEHAVDLVICTGDYTALGTDVELAAARDAIACLTQRPNGFLTVPGNHDVYLQDVVRERRFERHFGAFLASDLPERCVDGPWPIVKLFDNIAVIAVNSARPNPAPWISSGAIPDVQLSQLAALCQEDRIRDKFVFVITHYAPRRANAQPDHELHGLDNADAFLDACRGLERCAILHGHIHSRFQVALTDYAPRIFGAGSATCDGREGFWLFNIDAKRQEAMPGHWERDHYVVDETAAVSF